MNKHTTIAVSACLLGEAVRYDGRSKGCASLLKELINGELNYLSICPEILGGLSCPREPCEINKNTGKVITQSGQDLTDNFTQGAHLTLEACKLHGVRVAILKSNSPSCGLKKIYDGNFSGTLIHGSGITAKLLMEHGLSVFDESELTEALKLAKQQE